MEIIGYGNGGKETKMEGERADLAGSPDEITPGGYRFIMVWAACLLLLYAMDAFSGVAKLRSYAAEAEKTRHARIASPTTRLNEHVPDITVPSKVKPVDVLIGGSINRIGEFALKDAGWTAEFALWFTWSSDAINPGKSFRIVNGQVLLQEKGESYRRGHEHYAEYRVIARMVKPFETLRFPFSEEGLFIQVEDSAHGADSLRYRADKKNSGIDPEALPQGITLTRFLVDTKVADYGSRPVNTGPAGSNKQVRSQFILAMLLVPDGLGIYQKMFQALFASVAVALIALYIKPIHVDCRFGLPVGGFFASVSNNIFVASLLPHADRLTLTDMINRVSLFTIFLILVQSVISLYIFDSMGRERLSRYFDRVSFAVFLVGYITVNLALPLAARPL